MVYIFLQHLQDAFNDLYGFSGLSYCLQKNMWLLFLGVLYIFYDQHIQVWKNGRHFANIFKCIFLIEKKRVEMCPKGFIWQKDSIGPGNGLVSYRQQAITWTIADPELQCNMVSLGQNELIPVRFILVWFVVSTFEY